MPSKAAQPFSGDQGAVLVLALWAVAVVALGAAAVIAIGQVQQRIVRNEVAALREEMALQSGLHVVLHGLVSRPAEWPLDGRSKTITVGADRIVVTIADEAGKIDINMAAEDLLLGLLRPFRIGDEQKRRIAAAIQDWRDRDDERRLQGSEKADYASAGYRYEPRNRPFANAAELQRVAGITRELYRDLESVVTVYSQRPGVDSEVAEAEVLLRLPGMDAAAVNGILQARRTESKASGTPGHVGRTVRISTTVSERPQAMQWDAVVRLTGTKFYQLRVMASHRTAVLN